VKADSEVASIFDASAIGGGRTPLLGIMAGGGYVDLHLTTHGRLLLAPNFEPPALTLLRVSVPPAR